jgi:SAM-dependent methyltransferase
MINLDDLNMIWEKNLNRNSFDNRYYEPIFPFVNQYLLFKDKLKGNLLDLGCGYGTKSEIFHKIGFNVTGIDHDTDRIFKAKTNYPEIDFRHYNIISTLPFEDNSFDVIFSFSVFQYLEHRSILNECKRILKPNGCLIIIENLKNNPITRLGRTYLKLTKYNYQSYPYNHFRYKDILLLSKEFKDASIHFFHILTPLSYPRIANKFYDQFAKIDKLILNVNMLERLSWLSFFAGLNNK